MPQAASLPVTRLVIANAIASLLPTARAARRRAGFAAAARRTGVIRIKEVQVQRRHVTAAALVAPAGEARLLEAPVGHPCPDVLAAFRPTSPAALAALRTAPD